jgi:hypothetical protein
MNRTRSAIAALAVGAALVAPAAVLATDLHQTPPITASSQTPACDGSEDLAAGEVLWHFILTGAESTGAQITAEFKDFGVVGPQSADKVSGNATHFNIVTNTGLDEQLLSASTDIDGDLLNLSHVCYGPVESESVPVESESVPVESESVPVESAPVESTPVESTPVESTPVESAPVESEVPSGSVEAETGTPAVTPPPTDALSGGTRSGDVTSLILLLASIALVGALSADRARARARR